MRKKLLMLNASEHEIPFILAARKIGFYVITTSTKPEYAGHQYGDEYVPGDYNDYEEMIWLMKKYEVDAISQGCTDDCALAAAYIGEKLRLNGHDTYQNAQIIHRKDYFKKFTAENQVISPLSKNFTDLKEAVSCGSDLEFPVIIKPTDLAGGQGVHVARDRKEYEQYVREAFERSKAKKIVTEPFIEGTLHSLNTFLVDRKVVSYCTANDYSFRNPYLTSSGIAPADHWEEAVKVLIPETERIAGLLGLVDGQLHMQYILSHGKPWIIEMMRRNIGNNWMTMLTDSAGVNWPEWVIRAEAGMDCSAIPRPGRQEGYYGYHMIMGEKNGVFKSIYIEPEFQKYVYQFNQWRPSGHIIENYLSEKMGYLAVHFRTREEKERYMPRIHEFVHVMY